MEKKYTTKGPHNDNIEFIFNNRPIKTAGSQGEKKLFLIVLKIAEAIYIHKTINKEPIILLDDLFALLDKKRGHKKISLGNSETQILSFLEKVSLEGGVLLIQGAGDISDISKKIVKRFNVKSE